MTNCSFYYLPRDSWNDHHVVTSLQPLRAGHEMGGHSRPIHFHYKRWEQSWPESSTSLSVHTPGPTTHFSPNAYVSEQMAGGPFRKNWGNCCWIYSTVSFRVPLHWKIDLFPSMGSESKNHFSFRNWAKDSGVFFCFVLFCFVLFCNMATMLRLLVICTWFFRLCKFS